MKKGDEVGTTDGSSDGPSDGYKDGETVGLLDDTIDPVSDASVLRFSDGLLVLSEIKFAVGLRDNIDGLSDGRKDESTVWLVGSYTGVIEGGKLEPGDRSTDVFSARSKNGAAVGLLFGSPIGMEDVERIGESDGTRVGTKEGVAIGLLVGSSVGVKEGDRLIDRLSLVDVFTIKLLSGFRLEDSVSSMLRSVGTSFGFVDTSDGVDDAVLDGFELGFSDELSTSSVDVCVVSSAAMSYSPVVDSTEGVLVSVPRVSEFGELILHLQKGKVSVQVQVCTSFEISPFTSNNTGYAH
jgi:hypothetical protein